MAEPEQDPERRARVEALKQALMQAVQGHTISDMQVVVANMVAQVAIAQPLSENIVLITIECISEVFRGYLEHQRRGTPIPSSEVVN